jgi:hypothetical protein
MATSDKKFDDEFEEFRKLVNVHMSFLKEEFTFRETRAGKLYPGMWVYFGNSATQVTVNFEYASGLWVALEWLGADGITPVDGFALGHLLMVRAPHLARLVTPKDFEQEAIERALQTQANLLQQYASDVLAGNFEILPEVAKVRDADVAKRHADYLSGR